MGRCGTTRWMSGVRIYTAITINWLYITMILTKLNIRTCVKQTRGSVGLSVVSGSVSFGTSQVRVSSYPRRFICLVYLVLHALDIFLLYLASCITQAIATNRKKLSTLKINVTGNSHKLSHNFAIFVYFNRVSLGYDKKHNFKISWFFQVLDVRYLILSFTKIGKNTFFVICP